MSLTSHAYTVCRTPTRYSAQLTVQVEEAISGRQPDCSCSCSWRGSRSCLRACCCSEASPGLQRLLGKKTMEVEILLMRCSPKLNAVSLSMKLTALAGASIISLQTDPRCAHLSKEEEEMVVEFRRRTLLPLDDLLGHLREALPQLTRSALHRCLIRHGISKRPNRVMVISGVRRDRRGGVSC
jgi:hypothetical protein